MESNGEKTSRRDVLKLGAYGLGAIGAISIASSANAQVATKAQQKAVMRQQTPKDGKQCIGCQHYEVASSPGPSTAKSAPTAIAVSSPRSPLKHLWRSPENRGYIAAVRAASLIWRAAFSIFSGPRNAVLAEPRRVSVLSKW